MAFEYDLHSEMIAGFITKIAKVFDNFLGSE